TPYTIQPSKNRGAKCSPFSLPLSLYHLHFFRPPSSCSYVAAYLSGVDPLGAGLPACNLTVPNQPTF
ncbi:Unknown protein, partial [Striga hermonthica]